MNLLKINNHIINMENVIHIIDEDDEITIFFNTYDRDRPYLWRFKNEEATQLRKWLAENSTNL